MINHLKSFVLLVALTLVLAGPAGSYPDSQSLSSSPAFVTGKLLVASPSMPGQYFSQTVIVMLRHDQAGAFGLVINRKGGEATAAELARLLGDEPDKEEKGQGRRWPVLAGGPVEIAKLFMLHEGEWSTSGTLKGGRYAVSSPPPVMEAEAKGEGPRQGALVFGYSGWGPGQLEGELARRDWLVVEADDDLVFGPDYEGKWKRAVGKHGVDL